MNKSSKAEVEGGRAGGNGGGGEEGMEGRAMGRRGREWIGA